MSVRKGIKQKMFATLSAFAVLCAFSSCASSSGDAATADAVKAPESVSPSDSLIVENQDSKADATEVADANVFSDLQPAKDKNSAPTAAASTATTDGDTYYNSVGGETLRRVAYTLYGDKSFAKKLLARNPDLKGVKKLAASQRVYFDMDGTHPEPRYLTKDLLDRYAEPLSQRLQSTLKEKGLGETTATLGKGESLQDLSERLYGTHRYWPEIYLVNRDKIRNYDRVPAGLTLSVVNHPGLSPVAKAEVPPVASKVVEPVLEPKPAPVVAAKPVPRPVPAKPAAPLTALPIQPTPLPTQSAPEAKAPPADPIPEIPPVEEKKVAPLPINPAPIAEAPKSGTVAPLPVPPTAKKPVAPAIVDDLNSTSSNSSLRRILYVVLILALGGAAFYFTRTPKRPKPDMLDLNTEASARPKLAPKDSQQSQLG
jgi:hypothetical protein